MYACIYIYIYICVYIYVYYVFMLKGLFEHVL